jgi:hypothetical protein
MFRCPRNRVNFRRPLLAIDGERAVGIDQAQHLRHRPAFRSDYVRQGPLPMIHLRARRTTHASYPCFRQIDDLETITAIHRFDDLQSNALPRWWPRSEAGICRNHTTFGTSKAMPKFWFGRTERERPATAARLFVVAGEGPTGLLCPQPRQKLLPIHRPTNRLPLRADATDTNPLGWSKSQRASHGDIRKGAARLGVSPTTA